MTMLSYTCRYMAAILLFGVSCFAAFGAQNYAALRAKCIREHPTLTLEQCESRALDQMQAETDRKLTAFRESRKVKPTAATPAAISTASSEPSGLLWALILFGALLYLLPAFVASGRHHHQLAAIWILNIFLGWTLLGWVGALVWASTATHAEPRPT